MMVRASAFGRSLAVAACAATIGVLGHAGAARADFTETFCSGGLPAAPWVNGVPGVAPWTGTTVVSCGLAGGAEGFGDGTTTIPPGSNATGILAAPNEQFTHMTIAYTPQEVTNGDLAYVLFGYYAGGGATPYVDAMAHVDPAATSTIDEPLPDASEIFARYDCDAGSGSTCDVAGQFGVLEFGAVTLTVHDTTAPSVAATGGSLDAHGTVKGAQTLLYHATDAGSGVASATVSLGSTVVGTTQSTCQAASLTPCPAAANGTITANTALVPDGTYPVILTASDASGDGTPVQVATVTVANRTGSSTVPHPRGTRHARRVDIHVVFHWDVQRRTTKLTRVTVGRMPRRAVIHLSCTAKRCPFHHLTASARTVRRLERHLRNRRFRPGQKLHYTASAPHLRAQRATLTIRRTRLPRVSGGR